MGTLEKILNILKMKNEPKSYGVKFYAEMKLDDGRVVATEDEQFVVGSKVFSIADDGNAEALSSGSYTLENGDKFTIGDKSEILDLGEEKEAEETEASEEEMAEEVKEEMADAEDTDWAKTFEEMKDRVAALEEKVFGKKAEEETEEMAEESEAEETDWAKTYEEMKDRVEALEKAVYGENVNVEASAENKTEMSSEDVIGKLMTEVEELKSKIVELSNEPAEEGITYSPEGKNVNTTMDLRKLSTKERVAYYINNK